MTPRFRRALKYVSGGSSTSCANRAANAERDIPTFDASDSTRSRVVVKRLETN
jgi:hypothetical protein